MELPWAKNRRLNEQIDSLQAELSKIRDKLEKTQKKLEAEQKRRSKLAREKQDAEEKINKLEDKLQTLKNRDSVSQNETKSEFESVTPETLKKSLEKLDRVRGENLVTVYSPGKLREHSEVTKIKNSVPRDLFDQLSGKKSILLFCDEHLGVWCYRTRPFFNEKFCVKDNFEVGEILTIFKNRKVWAQVSRGDSRIMEENEGKIEELDKIRDRVDRKHGKGGFSQGRFERKRNEQISQHFEKVEKRLEKLDQYYVLGDREIAQRFNGEYLGGYDPLKSPKENFYQAQRLKYCKGLA